MPRRIGICIALAALSACSGPDLPGSHNTNNNTPATCTIAFSGESSASGACTAAVVFSFAANQTLFTLSIPSAVGLVNTVTLTMVLKGGQPATGIFTETTAVSTQMDILIGTQDWLTSRNIAGLTTQGTASLTITELGTEHVTTDGDKTYTGTQAIYDAVAPFRTGTGAVGTISAHVIF